MYLRDWEQAHDIYCGYGRGSVSGSEVAYILGITQMDSIKFGLNFFRFMNPSRLSSLFYVTTWICQILELVKSLHLTLLL